MNKDTIVSAIILRYTDYGESDRVVHFLTKDHGQVAAIVRGARASKKKYSGLIDLGNLLDGGRVEEGTGQALLDGQDATALGLEADGRRAELDRLDGILDLEEAALRAEGVDSSVVFGSG